MKKKYFLNKFFSLHFFRTTALQFCIALLFFFGLTLKAQPQCGPVVTLYQTFGNATTGKTEVPPSNQTTKRSIPQSTSGFTPPTVAVPANGQ
jgi:hypothetical protein